MQYQVGNFNPKNVYTCHENGPRLVAVTTSKTNARLIVDALNSRKAEQGGKCWRG